MVSPKVLRGTSKNNPTEGTVRAGGRTGGVGRSIYEVKDKNETDKHGKEVSEKSTGDVPS